MQNFRPVTHLDVFDVVATLHRRQRLFDEGIAARGEGLPGFNARSILLRGPENPTRETWTDDEPNIDLPALTDWPAMQMLLDDIRAAIGTKQPYGKVMVSRLPPQSIIPWHTDTGAYHEGDKHIRFHLPLITNPLAFLYSGAEALHIPVGSLWWFSNHITHSAVNWGRHDRIHLIADFRRAEEPS